VDGPISAEVLATDYEGIVREGRELAKLHKNVVVKVPLIADGLKAVKTFTKPRASRPTSRSASASTQGLLAAKAGATYISPFVGRVDDISGDGMDLIEQLVTVYANYGLKTKVLAASIRHPRHVVECLMLGAHVGTLPRSVILQLVQHPLTDLGLAKFLEDAKKIPVEPDEHGEAGLQRCSARETLEEVGLEVEPERFARLGTSVYLTPGLIAEKIHLLHARVDPGQAGEPSLDGSPVEERARIEWVPLAEALAACRDGRIEDIKTELALRRLAELA
jgi:transaldolase